MAKSSFGKVLGLGALVGGAVWLWARSAKASPLPGVATAMQPPPLVVATPVPRSAVLPPLPTVVATPVLRAPTLTPPVPGYGGPVPGSSGGPSSGSSGGPVPAAGPSGGRQVPYGGVRPASVPAVAPVGGTAPGAMGVPGTATEVPGYATKGEQTFGPDDTLTPLSLGAAFDLDTQKALPGNTTLPKIVRLTVAGFRWVGDETGAGVYRYVVANPLSTTLFGFDAATITRNLASGTFARASKVG